MGCRPSKADFIGENYSDENGPLHHSCQRHGNRNLRRCNCRSCRSRSLPHTHSFPSDARNQVVTSSDSWCDSKWQTKIGTSSSGSSLSHTRDFSTVTSTTGRSTIRVTLSRDGSMIEVEKFESPPTDTDDVDNSSETSLLLNSPSLQTTKQGSSNPTLRKSHCSLPNLRSVNSSPLRDYTNNGLLSEDAGIHDDSNQTIPTLEPEIISQIQDYHNVSMETSDDGFVDEPLVANGNSTDCDHYSVESGDCSPKKSFIVPSYKFPKSRTISGAIGGGFTNAKCKSEMPHVDAAGECSNSMLSPQNANCSSDNVGVLYTELQTNPSVHASEAIVNEKRPVFTLYTPELARSSRMTSSPKLPPINSHHKSPSPLSLLSHPNGTLGESTIFLPQLSDVSPASSNVSSTTNTPKLKKKKGFNKCKHSSLDLPENKGKSSKSATKTPQKSSSSGWLSKLKDKDENKISGAKQSGTPKTPKKSLSSDWLSKLTIDRRNRDTSSRIKPPVDDKPASSDGNGSIDHLDVNLSETNTEIHTHENFFRDFGDDFDDEADFGNDFER